MRAYSYKMSEVAIFCALSLSRPRVLGVDALRTRGMKRLERDATWIDNAPWRSDERRVASACALLLLLIKLAAFQDACAAIDKGFDSLKGQNHKREQLSFGE